MYRLGFLNFTLGRKNTVLTGDRTWVPMFYPNNLTPEIPTCNLVNNTQQKCMWESKWGFDTINCNNIFCCCLQTAINKSYLALVDTMLTMENFYYSATYDLTHTMQRLHNTTPEFHSMPLHERVSLTVFDKQKKWLAYKDIVIRLQRGCFKSLPTLFIRLIELK